MENVTVVTFIEQHMQQHGISLEILNEEFDQLGLPELQMILKGVAKLPTRVVPALARCLRCEPAELMRVVLQDYMPTTWSTLQDVWPCIKANCQLDSSRTLLDASADPS